MKNSKLKINYKRFFKSRMALLALSLASLVLLLSLFQNCSPTGSVMIIGGKCSGANCASSGGGGGNPPNVISINASASSFKKGDSVSFVAPVVTSSGSTLLRCNWTVNNMDAGGGTPTPSASGGGACNLNNFILNVAGSNIPIAVYATDSQGLVGVPISISILVQDTGVSPTPTPTGTPTGGTPTPTPTSTPTPTPTATPGGCTGAPVFNSSNCVTTWDGNHPWGITFYDNTNATGTPAGTCYAGSVMNVGLPPSQPPTPIFNFTSTSNTPLIAGHNCKNWSMVATYWNFPMTGGGGTYQYTITTQDSSQLIVYDETASHTNVGQIDNGWSADTIFATPSAATTTISNLDPAHNYTYSFFVRSHSGNSSVKFEAANVVAICTGPSTFNCGSILGFPRELDGRGIVVPASTNAAAACTAMGYTALVDFTTATHSTSCSSQYGLVNFVSGGFAWGQYGGICGGNVTIINQIRCR